jgi:hypothetical protein
MARDIEEFLRKAAERRQQKGGAPQQQQPRQAKPPPQQQPPRQPPRPEEPMIIEAVEADIVEARPARRSVQSPPQKPPKRSSIRNQSVADHVQSHIDTSGIAEHASSLGERISSVHDQVDARIHERLDRDLTAIDDKPSVTEAPRKKIFGATNADKAAELHELLQNPKSVGQAILIAEILKRRNLK